MAESGIYFLVFKNADTNIAVGSLGIIHFKEGWHIYTGSALGKAGFLRVKRHFFLAENKDKKPRWHLDYLLLSDEFQLKYAVVAKTSERLECEAAKKTGGDYVPCFGCSDCKCKSHLFSRKSDPLGELSKIFLSFGLSPQIMDMDACLNLM
ncbi:MAG: GIY-YIG nuclease family protein [Methanomicrobium sp.]|nr:GIY-YIG nuclease family protein [Methanomicrobium sp.]